MAFRTFYLFYLLAILLLALGVLTKDIEIIAAGWHTTIIRGMWAFFLPAAVGSLFIALVYHYWFKSGRSVRRAIVILHFVFVSLGLLFSVNLYRLTLVLFSSGAPDTGAAATNGGAIMSIVLGPALLVTSLIVFIIGLIRSGRTTA